MSPEGVPQYFSPINFKVNADDENNNIEQSRSMFAALVPLCRPGYTVGENNIGAPNLPVNYGAIQ